MTNRISQSLQTALILAALVLPASAQTASDTKLDESLREALERGCVGTQSVIIRTKPGYRQGLRDSLSAHADVVNGEFPALDAVAAEVHCDDLTTIAGFSSTNSVSINARVGVQTLGLEGVFGSVISDAQAAVTQARAALMTAKGTASTAQVDVRNKEKTADKAQAEVAAAQKAVAAANRLSGSAKITALAAAHARLSAGKVAVRSAQDAEKAARVNATGKQAATLVAQKQLVAAQNAYAAAFAGIQDRIREGRAARDLKKKFFATMPIRGASQIKTDEDLDAESNDSGNWQDAFGQVATGGAAVGVAIIDSGIEAGADFGNRITAFYDFTAGDIRAVAPLDPYGHGTHVAGLVASEFTGVAPKTTLIGLRVLDDKGQGLTTDVVRAIEFAIANKTLLGIKVLNLSLGHPIFESAKTDPLVQAVEHAVREGLVVVTSAGNFGLNRRTGASGYAGITSPGNAPSALTVGASRTFDSASRGDDRVAPYSSRGPSWYDGYAKPDVIAPGDNLLSVAAVNSYLRAKQELRGNVGNYMRLSGTSMAAGVASGVVALMLQANEALTPNTVKGALEYSAIPMADDTGKRFDALTQGAGQIGAAGALAFARAINPAAPMGTAWLKSSITPSTVIANQTYAWSQSLIWGDRRLSGSDVMSEQRPAWALNIVWGNGLGDDDDNIVWGNGLGDDDDNIVWGNNIVWGYGLGDDDDNIVWGNGLGDDDDNIVWGNNIVWGDGLVGLLDDDNIVWGNLDDDNIVWGNLDDDNIVWGNLFDEKIVNGLLDDDNIVWGNSLLDDDDNIVWGNSTELGNITKWSGGVVGGRASNARARRTRVRLEAVVQ